MSINDIKLLISDAIQCHISLGDFALLETKIELSNRPKLKNSVNPNLKEFYRTVSFFGNDYVKRSKEIKDLQSSIQKDSSKEDFLCNLFSLMPRNLILGDPRLNRDKSFILYFGNHYVFYIFTFTYPEKTYRIDDMTFLQCPFYFSPYN